MVTPNLARWINEGSCPVGPQGALFFYPANYFSDDDSDHGLEELGEEKVYDVVKSNLPEYLTLEEFKFNFPYLDCEVLPGGYPLENTDWTLDDEELEMMKNSFMRVTDEQIAAMSDEQKAKLVCFD